MIEADELEVVQLVSSDWLFSWRLKIGVWDTLLALPPKPFQASTKPVAVSWCFIETQSTWQDELWQEKKTPSWEEALTWTQFIGGTLLPKANG